MTTKAKKTGSKTASRTALVSTTEPAMSPQLALFQIAGNQNDTYSNSIEIYDAIPKGIWAKENGVSGNGFRGIVKKHVVKANKRVFDVMLTPKIFSNPSGEDTVRYPTTRDMRVEDCLRLLATQGLAFNATEQSVGVFFSVNLLRKKLASTGHSYSPQEILESLNTLAGCSIEVTQRQGEGSLQVTGNILSGLTIATRDDMATKKVTRCFATFHPLVSYGILNQKFRMFNYQISMDIRNELAHYMYRRMTHYWTQASHDAPYEFKMNSYLEQATSEPLSNNSASRRKIKNCLDELIRVKVVSRYDDEAIPDPNDRRKKADFAYTVWPTDQFIRELKMWNKANSDILAKAEELGLNPIEQRPAPKRATRRKAKKADEPAQQELGPVDNGSDTVF